MFPKKLEDIIHGYAAGVGVEASQIFICLRYFQIRALSR